MKCLAYFTYKVGMPFLNMCELEGRKPWLPCWFSCWIEQDKYRKTKFWLGEIYSQQNVQSSSRRIEDSTWKRVWILWKKNTPKEQLMCRKWLTWNWNLFHPTTWSAKEISLCPVFTWNAEANAQIVFFKARCVRDNVILHQSSQVKQIEQEIQSILDQREHDWYKQQKELKSEHFRRLIEKGKDRENYIDKVLAKCKSWNGPFLTIDEMKSGLANEDEDGQRKILRHEITFQKTTHVSDALVRKELYLINKQSVGTMTVYFRSLAAKWSCSWAK